MDKDHLKIKLLITVNSLKTFLCGERTAEVLHSIICMYFGIHVEAASLTCYCAKLLNFNQFAFL